VADPKKSVGLVLLASLLARASRGKVLAVSVAQDLGPGKESVFYSHRDLLGRVHETLDDPSTEIELIPRMAASHAQGILHTAHEQTASLIVMGWRGKRTLRENVLGSVLDEVIWGSDTPVIVGRIEMPLNSMEQVIFIIPPKVIPMMVLRRMFEANLKLAEALGIPLVLRADKAYLQAMEALMVSVDSDHPADIEPLGDHFKPAMLEQESIRSFVVVPGFGSRKRVADTLGNLPEQFAASFDGNLAILHFDK
jgi:nucleotide-binding universal stress UspA family protein